MQTHIDLITRLFETPALMSTDYDFGMGSPDRRRKIARWASEESRTRVLEETDEFRLLKVEADRGGHFLLVDKAEGEAKLMVRYDITAHPGLGRAATQIELWRDVSYAPANGQTRRIFFEFLLPLTGIVLSDSIQTRDGMRFWVNMMATAHVNRLEVGLYDENTRNIFPFDGTTPLDDWARREWGEGGEFEERRFFVRTK